MRTTTVCLTAATAYSIYILVCLRLSPNELGGIKGMAGLFVFALGLFAIGEKKIQATHVARSALIAVSVGSLVSLAYILLALTLQPGDSYTILGFPALLFSPIAVCTALLAFKLIRTRAEKAIIRGQ